jgi:hypothetical protein
MDPLLWIDASEYYCRLAPLVLGIKTIRVLRPQISIRRLQPPVYLGCDSSSSTETLIPNPLLFKVSKFPFPYHSLPDVVYFLCTHHLSTCPMAQKAATLLVVLHWHKRSQTCPTATTTEGDGDDGEYFTLVEECIMMSSVDCRIIGVTSRMLLLIVWSLVLFACTLSSMYYHHLVSNCETSLILSTVFFQLLPTHLTCIGERDNSLASTKLSSPRH